MPLSRLSRAEDVEVSDVSLCPVESDALQTDIFLSLLVSRCSECSLVRFWESSGHHCRLTGSCGSTPSLPHGTEAPVDHMSVFFFLRVYLLVTIVLTHWPKCSLDLEWSAVTQLGRSKSSEDTRADCTQCRL